MVDIIGGGGSFQSVAIAMPSRERFYVELKPGETTFVSWKTLLKESRKTADSVSHEAPQGAHPALEGRIAPEVMKGEDPLPPPANRFNAVIERIERLYQGGMSDDEPSDVLEDDKYDTRDSFIDDTELDDYFSLEDAKLKHTGFFVNKGKLEQEAKAFPQNHKKRKRKDLKMLSSSVNQEEPKKSKLGARLKATAREILLSGSTPSKKNFLKEKTKGFRGPGWELGKSLAMAVVDNELNRVSSSSMVFAKGVAKEKLASKALREPISADDLKLDVLGGVSEPLEAGPLLRFELGSKSKYVQKCSKEDTPKKLLVAAGKDNTPRRNKGTALRRALLDLEKGVAELCPPSSSLVLGSEQNSKNHLPRPIKQKLAKIARLSAKQGRLTDELIDRLMGILGHIMQVNTLKRTLKAMVEMGLSAMQEKANRLQSMKDEVRDMIKARILNMQSQGTYPPNNIESPCGAPYQWDHAMEDKIFDLYEEYIEGMDDNKGPHLRMLYAELVELWPVGWMDKIGIKDALQRAKERKKLQSKAGNATDGKKRGRPAALKPKLEDASNDGVSLMQLVAPNKGSHDARLTEATSLSKSGNEGLLHVQEKRKMSGKFSSTEIKSKTSSEGGHLERRPSREMDFFVTEEGKPLVLDKSSSMQSHTPIGSSVGLSLPGKMSPPDT